MNLPIQRGHRLVQIDAWHNVGVYPTPHGLVSDFTSALAEQLSNSVQIGAVVKLLDACAGDGRLGDSLAAALLSRGYRPELTLIDVDLSRAEVDKIYGYPRTWVAGNFFEFEAKASYDVVVSNPPYLAINRQASHELGICWERVKQGGRNLYGIALLHAFAHCANKGLVGFIAPHGWIRNRYADELRSSVGRNVSTVCVRAFSSRTMFPGVIQDTSIQMFELDRSKTDPGTQVLFSYDGSAVDVSLRVAQPPSRDTKQARVGPFVWNREKDLISKIRRGIPVIYGGNITREGQVDLSVEKYIDRQYLVASRVPSGHLSSGPCFVIKRSMRGNPGAWIADCAFIPSGFNFVPENHVIVAHAKSRIGSHQSERIRLELSALLGQIHRDCGHPNLAIGAVREATAQVLGE